ncbi:MAG: prohibitin family protein [Patescibacteria group bacterium]|jgi:regulator of protease activity HflC (stomatin/prohibitin superfamily)
MAFEDLVVTLLVDEVVGGFFISVPPGHIACIHDLGVGVLPKVYGPGLHFKIPFWQTAKLFNAQTLEYTISEEFDPSHPESLGDKPIEVTTQDGVPLQVKGTILFKLNKAEAPMLWENVGDHFVPKVVRPFTRNQISSVFSRVTIDQIAAYRHQIEHEIYERLGNQLKDKGLILEKVLLSEIKRIEHKEEAGN